MFSTPLVARHQTCHIVSGTWSQGRVFGDQHLIITPLLTAIPFYDMHSNVSSWRPICSPPQKIPLLPAKIVADYVSDNGYHACRRSAIQYGVRINSFMFQPSGASWSVVVEAISKWGVECCAEFWIFWSPSGVIWWILKFWVFMEDRYNYVLCHGGPLRDILEGKMLAKRSRGRKRLQLLSNICYEIMRELTTSQ